MKKITAAVLAAIMCISLFACGKDRVVQPDDEKPERTPVTIPEKTEIKKENTGPAEVQEIVTFFEGIRPVSVTSDREYYYARYSLGPGGMDIVHQYIDLLTEGDYGLVLLKSNCSEDSQGISEYYYFRYEGDAAVKPVWDDQQWHIAVEADLNKTTDKAYISAKYSPDFYLKDDGHRANLSRVTETIILPTPEPTPQPAPQPTPVPAAKPQQETVTHTAPRAPVVTVDKNASYIPEFSAFLSKSPSEEKDRYYGGTRKYYQKLPLDTQNTVVSEVLALLDNDRYQLELIEKVDADNRIEYNYRYTGNVGMDSIHSKNDGTRYYNLQFTVYNKNNDNGYYGIHFHYAPQFTEENVGYTVSAGLPGGSGGGGGTVDFEGGDIPEFSKLECLTCHGTKDCPSCSGRGFKVVDDINKDCTRCNRGTCPACGGTGTRS